MPFTILFFDFFNNYDLKFRKARDKIKFETNLTFTPVEYKIIRSFAFISTNRAF